MHTPECIHTLTYNLTYLCIWLRLKEVELVNTYQAHLRHDSQFQHYLPHLSFSTKFVSCRCSVLIRQKVMVPFSSYHVKSDNIILVYSQKNKHTCTVPLPGHVQTCSLWSKYVGKRAVGIWLKCLLVIYVLGKELLATESVIFLSSKFNVLSGFCTASCR